MSHHHIGLDWRTLVANRLVGPADTFRYCDLRGVVFDGADLSASTFVGCRLNGTSFRSANLSGVQFVGCFSGTQGEPTDLRDCNWQNVRVSDSNLHVQANTPLGEWQWPAAEAEAAWATLSPNNTIRYEATERLGQLANPATAPIIATLLFDPQWDVRSIALRTLDRLVTDVTAPDREELWKWIWFRLGDDHPIVRNNAVAIAMRNTPPDQSLLPALNRICDDDPASQLQGLRTAAKLLDIDRAYARLVNRECLGRLSHVANEEVRAASRATIAKLEEPF